MNTAFLIYLVMQLDTVNGLLGAIVTISLCVLSLMAFFMAMLILDNDTDEEAYKVLSQWFKKIVPVALAFSLIFTLMPSTKTAIYMTGGAGVVEILQSEQAQEVGGKAYRLLMKKLDEELEE